MYKKWLVTSAQLTYIIVNLHSGLQISRKTLFLLLVTFQIISKTVA